MATAPHALVSPVSARALGSPESPLKTAYFLHGILGSGGNLRTLAKRVLELASGWEIVLVDLPGHGRSEPMAKPHTLASCATAVTDLADTLQKPAIGIVGHSFGGKVALVASETAPDLRVCCTLDSAPGARLDHHGSEGTLRVIEALRALPARFATRPEFASALRTAGLTEDLIAWLALNLVATDDGGFRFRLDLAVIDALLEDYFVRDCWPVLETESSVNFSVVIGGASNVWDDEERARAERAKSGVARLAVTVIPGASHWLHVDALEATASAIAAALNVAT